ncbi:MAG: right-handed parallel beta-helix repeat-containing protein [Verrucomicrobiaceae bacterium]
MRFKTTFVTLLTTLLSGLPALAQSPAILGKGTNLFEVGPLLDSDNFDSLENWVVQIQQNKKSPPPKVVAKDNTLDCFLPGRGATIWFKRKLNTRVTITYDVLCPTSPQDDKNLLPRDINNFWMANDPDGDLFDSEKYTGDFFTYDQMHGYYASTGGGKNTTTRMRRYPRQVDGKPVAHPALISRDGQKEFLITPDKLIRVQLVAYDDLIQYIVDGKLVYEMAHGDPISVESNDGKKTSIASTYTPDLHPTYREGYFGFRMVGTHHIYSNFKIHTLTPVRPTVTVSSIKDLRDAVARSNQRIIMTPGTYTLPEMIDGRTGVEFSGSNNDIDLTDVTIHTPISLLSGEDPERDDRRRRRRSRRGMNVYYVSGDHVTITGGTFDNPHPLHNGTPIDFGSYNQNPANYPRRAMSEIRLEGDHLRLSNCHLTVRGSSPYGYGNIYGIGGDAVISLHKHSGILMTGDHITLDACTVKMEAFGHAIFVQGGDQITVRNCEVIGQVRPSNDLYKESHPKDLAKKFDYKMQWPETVHGIPIPRDHMVNLCEDGIRAYSGTGHMTVENCKVTKARGGIKLYMAKSATVSDCEVRDCVIQGYSLPSRGTITRSIGNAAYGPLLYIHADSHHSQKVDLEVLPAPHALGDHPLAALKGKNNHITFTAKAPLAPRPIIIGYPLRFDYLTADYPKVPKDFEAHFAKFAPDSYHAEDITLLNHTTAPVVLSKLSQDNTISSQGEVRDLGTDNTVRKE